MGRLLVRLVVFGALAWGAGLLIRSLLGGRAPRRALDGSGPIMGSIDTWPQVPRKEAQPTG